MAKQGKRVKATKLKPRVNRQKLIIGIVVGVLALVIYSQIAHYTKQARLEKELEQQTKTLQVKIKQLNSTTQSAEERQKQIEALQKQLEAKTKELQAKRETQARALAEAPQPTKQVAGAVAVSGSCEQWLAQAGVSDLGSARELIRRESSCNPNAVNSSSGACGIAQELPCGKSGCGLGNPVCQIRWMQGYVTARYGGWSQAIAWHNSHNWY
jgi:type II secretory pathway pseudopilin PulG